MEKIEGGATLWARKTIESDIFCDKPDKWFKIWFFLVNKANHKDTKKYKRGSCFIKYDWIESATKSSKSTVDHCIRWLKSATMLATQKKTRGMLITVSKYAYYQTLDNYYYCKSDTKSDLKAIQKRHRSDTKDKNDKNDKEYIQSFNEIFKTKYKETEEVSKALTYQLKTYTLEEIIQSVKNARADKWWCDKASPIKLLRHQGKDHIGELLNRKIEKKEDGWENL